MKYWVDVSDIYNWQGTFTGIQRVDYEIANYFKNTYGANLFVLNNGIFTEVETVRCLNIDENPTNNIGKVKLIKKIYLKSLSILPNRVAILIKKIVGKIKHLKNNALKKKIDDYVERSTSHTDPKNCPLTKQDVLIGLGLPRNERAYAICQYKNSVGFSYYQVVYDTIPFCREFIADGMLELHGYFYKLTLKYADLILSISTNTKNDLEKLAKEFGIKKLPPIKVFRLGEDLDDKIKAIKPNLDFKLAQDYILCVGTLEIRKNHMILYQAYKLALEKGIELPQLIICGRQGWLSDTTVNLITKDLSVQNKIKIISGITDSELKWLYKNCLFSVYPSMYEGWGLPIAESLAYGKFCLSSNSSSMPEVGKDFCDYFSPFDPRELMDKIDKYSNDTSALSSATQNVKANYKITTWRESAQEIGKIIGESRNE